MVSFEPFRETVPLQEDYSDRTFALIGRVMAMWSDIDDRVYSVFRIVLGTQEEVASTIYYRFNSLNDKLEITRKIVDLTLDDAAKEQFQKIYAHLKKGSEFRNNLAHNPVISAVSFNPEKETLQIQVYSHTSKNKIAKGKFMAGFEETSNHLSGMMDTYVALRSFSDELQHKQNLENDPEE